MVRSLGLERGANGDPVLPKRVALEPRGQERVARPRALYKQTCTSLFVRLEATDGGDLLPPP